MTGRAWGALGVAILIVTALIAIAVYNASQGAAEALAHVLGAVPIVVGARVRYSGKFLRSICAYTGALPFARGEVLELATLAPRSPSPMILARVNWTNDYAGEVPEKVNVANLEACR